MKVLDLNQLLIKHLQNYCISASLGLAWLLGATLGFAILFQLVSGLSVASHYAPHPDVAFSSIIGMCLDVPWGNLLRNGHSTGSFVIFALLDSHIARALYYGLYNNKGVWNCGILTFVVLIATAFLGQHVILS